MRTGKMLMLVVGLAALACSAVEARAAFPLQEGDVWVLAGDSITAQHLHSNYFEAFCFARYPQLKFAFRNSGVGGHTLPSTLARFDYDIAAWHPTVVSVELGMNDKGGATPDKYLTNMVAMVARIREIKARPVIFAASPVNDGSTMARLGGNQRLHEFAAVLKAYTAREQIPYADQFHALVDVWGANKSKETLANALPKLKEAAADDALVGVAHLRAFLAAQAQSPVPLVSLQGDAIHPGPPGQLMMAAELLKALGADGFVSSLTLDAGGQVVAAKGCQVNGVKAEGGRLAFDRLDERLPFPIPDEARCVLPLCPAILDLSRYTLQVTGLPNGNYTLKINGIAAATLAARELAAGVNLTAFGPAPAGEPGPILAQSRAVLAAVAGKEGLVNQWRSQSQRAYAAGAAPELKEQLGPLTKKVEEADEKIRQAARPQKLHFELAPQ